MPELSNVCIKSINVIHRDGKSVKNSTDANFRPRKKHNKHVIRDILQFAAKQRKFLGKDKHRAYSTVLIAHCL